MNNRVLGAGQAPPAKGVAVVNGDRRKGKRRSTHRHNTLLRCICFSVIATLIYVQFKVATTVNIEPPPAQAIHKGLEGFQKGSPRKSPDLLAVRNRNRNRNDIVSDIEAKESPTPAASLPNQNYAEKSLVLTAYLEPQETMVEFDIDNNEHDNNRLPSFKRNTSTSRLRSVAFPNANNCSTLMQNFPVDDFPVGVDGWLPWIHDYFPSLDKTSIHFVAQNRRRCDTGADNKDKMKFWAPQVSLFQGIPVVVEDPNLAGTKPEPKSTHGRRIGKDAATPTYRLASSFQEATHNATRFQCRFHHGGTTITTLSVFPFDYEFVNQQKHKKTMIFPPGDRDTQLFWLSQLVFTCPLPEEFQPLLASPSSLITTESSKKVAIDDQHQPALYVDLIPIRTPVRTDYNLLLDKLYAEVNKTSESAYLQEVFGRNHTIPSMDDAGRWENLPICRRSDNVLVPPSSSKSGGGRDQQQPSMVEIDTAQESKKPYRLVACTWASSAYKRRGDVHGVSDSVQRLKEWIQFHLMVDIDHIYVYDNTDTSITSGNSSDLYDVTRSFGADRVTYNPWPCKICNNNKPAQSSPGERSSQYAAESSCRKRYGELSEWMTFIDIDEYMVPMKQNEDGEYSWRPVMDEMDKLNISIMKFLSSKGKPRVEFTETLEDQSVCTDPDNIEKKKLKLPVQPCVGEMKNKTFLQVYNWCVPFIHCTTLLTRCCCCCWCIFVLLLCIQVVFGSKLIKNLQTMHRTYRTYYCTVGFPRFLFVSFQRLHPSTQAIEISAGHETNLSAILCFIALCALFHRDESHGEILQRLDR
uniref:Glycosyltransferase family 92 protein n=1 Tax=Pseudo-nitzschia australis TaxID=44445 RepID=A0A7S4AJF7_9STRA